MIRRFEPTDEDELIGVWLASTIPGQDFLPEEFWRSEEPIVRQELLPIAETWVVEEDGEIVAFVSLLDEMIGGLFTHPEHQGAGYGRALVEHVRARHDVVRVEVFRRNERAMAFYRKRGFVEESAQIHEETGLEAVVMRVAGSGRSAAELSLP
jgi:putative acetyltransferase